MRIASFAATSLAALLVAGVLTAAVQEKKGADKPEKKDMPKAESALVDSATAKYVEAIPGVMRAVISGDPTTGAYRAFTKFAPGTVHPMHSHPNEIWILVIKGAYIQKSESGEETRVGPGCSFHIPAGMKHQSSGDPKEGVVMLEESSAKFGMDMVDKGKEKEKK
jgi:quercetin dioxygenase-like cupin family protein